MATNIGVKVTGSGMKMIAEDLRLLAGVEVLVGVPEDKTTRQDDLGRTDANGKPFLGGTSALTNAELAYVHDNGAPEVNIPARPFMIPGIQAVEKKLAAQLGSTMRRVLEGGGALVIEQGLHKVGLTAQLSIQNTINAGVPPPLAESTLRARARRGRKGAAIELLSRSQGYAPSMDFAKPLVDTSQLRNSISYAIRSRRLRRK